MWKSKKLGHFFPLKYENLDPSWKIYYDLCSCGEGFVGETKRKVTVHFDEHSKPSKKSKTNVHLLKEHLSLFHMEDIV